MFQWLSIIALHQCPVASHSAQHLKAHLSLPTCKTSSFLCVLRVESTFLFLEFDEVLRLLLVDADADKDEGVLGLATSLPFILVGCQFVVGVSGEDDGSGVRGSEVEQEVGKRSYRYWRETWVNRATFEVGGKETGYYLGILHS
nr:hypothetical protein [Tanacetum cinerariifolium]